MAENYKLRYEQMKKIVTTYQDEVVPCLREIIKYLEQNQIKVRCKDCKHGCEDHEDAYLCNNLDFGLIGFTRGDDFCSYGERRTENGNQA